MKYWIMGVRLLLPEIRLHGRGGQGVVKAAEIIVSAAVAEGLYGVSVPFFGFERQGAPVAAFLRLSTKPIRPKTQVYRPDCVVVLDETLLKATDVFQGVRPGGYCIVNTRKKASELAVPENITTVGTVDATGLSLNILGANRPNTVMLGSFAVATGWVGVHTLADYAAGFFGEKNREAVLAGASKLDVCHHAPVAPAAELKEDLSDPSLEELEQPPAYPLTGDFAGPVGIELYVVNTGDWRLQRPEILRDRCNNCGVCFLFCPAGSVKLQDKRWEIDLRFCKGCGLCHEECPRAAITMVPEGGALDEYRQGA